MWDQRVPAGSPARAGRIIPTYVGSTGRPGAIRAADSNHSHVCGINKSSLFSPTPAAESFPRMWDQPDADCRIWALVRIIPTYVGSTDNKAVAQIVDANHSHVCGINDVLLHYQPSRIESFPRMWDQLESLYIAPRC